MSGGPLLPSSIYCGGAAGNAGPQYYIPNTNTSGAGAIEGVVVVANLGADAPVVLQFNMPPTIPSGTLKLRVLAWTGAGAGQVAKFTVKDKNAAAGTNLGTLTMNTETQVSQTWSGTADIIVENKVTLTTVPSGNDILAVVVTFNTTGWTTNQSTTWQFSAIWE